MFSVCVFCGSSLGKDPVFQTVARELGGELAKRKVRLVYGGSAVGLMGVLANAVLEQGGRVVGVIPRHLLDREVGHTTLTELHVVESMHQRKALMAELSDAFLALPGGVGTMEEFFEVWTWGQLGLHAKPYGILDVQHYFTPLIAFMDHMVEQRFLQPEHRALVLVDRDPAIMIDRLHAHRPPAVDNWLDRSET